LYPPDMMTGGMKPPLEISPEALRLRLEAGERLRLIDIRERDERNETEGAASGIVGENIPMFRLPHAVERLRHWEGAIVLFCRNGTRSLRAAAWLRRNGVPAAQSLTGGLEEWAKGTGSAAPRQS